MVLSFLILVLSTALFFFYIQAICERALRREFSHPYFQDILKSIQLEFPRLRDDLAGSTSLDYSEMRVALKCDFTTLAYLLRNSDRRRRHLSRSEKLLIFYFRILLFCLPIRHAFKLHEREATLKLTTILQHFANLTGERLSLSSMNNALPDLQS
jgi:hypothetical protein